MTEPMRRPFNNRAFWSLLAALTLLGLPWTGIEVHLHQADPLTADLHAWMAAHWVLATLFTVAGTAHIVLNFRALARYARALPARLVPASREALAAIVLTGALLFLGVGHAYVSGAGGRGAATMGAGGARATYAEPTPERSSPVATLRPARRIMAGTTIR
ncbi:MAG TPA: hypothetical protein VEB43_05320 [Anaeromyxobacter sp.]|nr:hypothetical protein [Anaeromyxobacter sp.]